MAILTFIMTGLMQRPCHSPGLQIWKDLGLATPRAGSIVSVPTELGCDCKSLDYRRLRRYFRLRGAPLVQSPLSREHSDTGRSSSRPGARSRFAWPGPREVRDT